MRLRKFYVKLNARI